MVFPVVMYECESWSIKKAEHWRIDTFELWCWRRLLRAPWTARRSDQSILKEISPGCSLERLMLKLKLQYFVHLVQRMDTLGKNVSSWSRPCMPAFRSDQIRSVAQLCPTLCDPMNCSTPGLPVHHQLLEFTQTHALSRWCHPTISSSVIPFSFCLQSFPALGSFQMVSSLHQVAKVLEFQLQHQSFQWTFRTDFL